MTNWSSTARNARSVNSDDGRRDPLDDQDRRPSNTETRADDSRTTRTRGKGDLGSLVVVLGDLLKEGLVKVEAQGTSAVWSPAETDEPFEVKSHTTEAQNTKPSSPTTSQCLTRRFAGATPRPTPPRLSPFVCLGDDAQDPT